MFQLFQNPVRTAVYRIGGPTKAANTLGVSNATIHAWIKRTQVMNIDKATVLAEKSGVALRDLRRVV